MPASRPITFDETSLHARLDTLTEQELDALDFGVIGFDANGDVSRYNTTESRLAGLSPERVLGNGLFTVVAPCMNNYLVAQRFHDAAAAGEALDLSLDYVFTLRMRPRKVKLRLLAAPGLAHRYVVVRWPAA